MVIPEYLASEYLASEYFASEYFAPPQHVGAGRQDMCVEGREDMCVAGREDAPGVCIAKLGKPSTSACDVSDFTCATWLI